MVSFRNNNVWLNNHPNEAIIFKDVENIWDELKIVYSNDFRNLVYGDFPDEDVVLKTLKMIQERLATIFWTIKS